MTRRFSPWLKSRVANVCRTCGPIPLVLIRDFLKYFFTDCSCDACAPISWTACVQREGLALSVWPSTQGSFLTALGAEVRGALVGCGDGEFRDYSLHLTLRCWIVCRCSGSHHRGHFADCAEVVWLIPPGWRKAGHRNHFGLYPLAFMQSSNTCYLLPTLAKVASRWHWSKSRS